MGSFEDIDAEIWSNTCWVICALAYFFLFTTCIHFCCTSWIDPRIPMAKQSKKWLYFISAHILRVINLIIAIVDMTFEQIADEITPHNTRVLGATVSCGVSARFRMSLFMTSFYTYGMFIIHIHINLLTNILFTRFDRLDYLQYVALFCWYKVAIVTIQSPDRNQLMPHLVPKIYRSRKKKKKRNKCLEFIIRRDHIFLDLLWYYINILFIVSITMGNFTSKPSNGDQGDDTQTCSHNDRWASILAYVIAVFVEFVALIIIFVTPLYQLMKTKKRLFRGLFSNIKIKRNKHHKDSKYSHKRRKSSQNNGHSEPLNNNQNGSSINSPAQQEFISRIKGTICRNSISGIISILVFSAFMSVYIFDAMSGSDTFFNSGFGYVVSFSCYLLNYLCLTFSYQNHWPMLFPICCQPPWGKFKYGGAKISLQPNQPITNSNQYNHITPLKLNPDDDLDDLRTNKISSSAIPIITTKGNNKTNGSFESLLASSHLSTTPKYATLNMNDNARMQKQYEEYLKKQQMMANKQMNNDWGSSGTSTNNVTTTTTSSNNLNIVDNKQEDGHERKYEPRRVLTPSSAQETMENKHKYSESLPAPKLRDKNDQYYYNREYPEDEDEDRLDDESEDGSSSEYDSEGIDSIQLRVGSYDAVNYRFSSVGYHDDNP